MLSSLTVFYDRSSKQQSRKNYPPPALRMLHSSRESRMPMFQIYIIFVVQIRRPKLVATKRKEPPPRRDSVTPTAAGVVYAKLRADILRGVLLPSERLRVNDIAGATGASHMPGGGRWSR